MIGEGIFSLKTLFITVGLWFSNPFVPDFGTQLMTAVTIGLLLPNRFVKPLSSIVYALFDFLIKKKFPGAKRFMNFLERHKKLRNFIPRIFAGYVITYAIGWSLLGIGYFLL